MLDQQGNSVRLTSENRAANRFEDSLLGHIGVADQIVELDGFGLLSLGQILFRTQYAALGNRRTDRRRRASQEGFEFFRRRIATDAAQGDDRGGCHFGIGVGKSLRQGIHRFGITANADGIDHAHQQTALHLVQGAAKGIVRGRIGNRLQSDPCPRGKILVGQECSERRDGVLRAADGQLLAGNGFVLRGSVRLKHLNQLLLFFAAGVLVVGGIRATGHRRGHGQEER